MRLRAAVAVERIFTSIHGLLSYRECLDIVVGSDWLNEAVRDCLALLVLSRAILNRIRY